MAKFKFGVFYRPVDALKERSAENPFANLEVAEIYTGPQFVRSKTTVHIPPTTIQYIRVGITPHKIHSYTTFLGNPHLFKHYKLLVSDFFAQETR